MRVAAWLVLGLGLLVGACDSAGSPTPTDAPTAAASPTADASATPTPTLTPTPPPGSVEPLSTGEPAVDAIVRAVDARDVVALAPLVRLEEVGCTTADGMGGPPKCAPGDAEGTVHRVLPVSQCEGGWTGNPLAALGRFAASARGLYAVLDATGVAVPEEWPALDRLLVFHVDLAGAPYAARLGVSDGQVVLIAYGCGLTPEEATRWLPNQPALPILAGPFVEPTIGAPEPPVSGVPEVDAILAAVATYDLAALVERTGLAEKPCVDVVRELEAVQCNAAKGEVPGDPVSVLPVAHCEGSLSRDAVATYEAMLNGAPALYAVVAAPEGEPDHGYWLTGRWWVVYTLGGAAPAPSVRLTLDATGRVVNVWYGCGATAEQQATFAGTPLHVVFRPQ